MTEQLAFKGEKWSMFCQDHGFAHSYVFQPVIKTQTSEIAFSEMLSRFEGNLTVQQFIVDAEKSGAIVPYDVSNLMRGIHLICSPNRPDGALAKLAVNLSAKTVALPWVNTFSQFIIDKYITDPSDLILEITETWPGEIESIKNFCSMAKEMQISIALDDFGDGHHSSELYRIIDCEIIKVCAEVIEKQIIHLPDKSIHINDFIKKAKDDGKQIVAENINSLPLYEKATEMGFDYLQGFYIAEPHANPYI